ncbi:MAG: rhomboid family intramembrane serine protease [Armatimonadota bacterium]|nr:rhomboid family intramembrane serine protease [bacterium]
MTLEKPSGKQGIPLAVISIIAVNVILAIVLSRHFDNAARDYGLIPNSFRIGRLITSSFLHDGVIHLVMNMTLLYIFGREVEWAIGRLEFLIFYIGACFAASIMHIAIVLASMDPYYAGRAVVGASGAIAGVMGLYAVRFHRRIFKLDGIEVSALFLIMCWLMMQLGLGVAALYRDDIFGLRLRYVAYWSHLGGFTFGIVTALIANMALQGEREYLTKKGRRDYDDGNLLEAAQDYDSLIKYDPDNAHAYAELGKLWAIMEEETQSLPYYRNAVKLYINQGNEEEALRVGEEMQQFWPANRRSVARRFRLASYLAEDGRYDRAIDEFKEIADDEPDSAEAQMSLLKIAHLHLSFRHDPAASIAVLNGFMERYPKSEWRRFAERTLQLAKDLAFQKRMIFPNN